MKISKFIIFLIFFSICCISCKPDDVTTTFNKTQVDTDVITIKKSKAFSSETFKEETYSVVDPSTNKTLESYPYFYKIIGKGTSENQNQDSTLATLVFAISNLAGDTVYYNGFSYKSSSTATPIIDSVKNIVQSLKLAKAVYVMAKKLAKGDSAVFLFPSGMVYGSQSIKNSLFNVIPANQPVKIKVFMKNAVNPFQRFLNAAKSDTSKIKYTLEYINPINPNISNNAVPYYFRKYTLSNGIRLQYDSLKCKTGSRIVFGYTAKLTEVFYNNDGYTSTQLFDTKSSQYITLNNVNEIISAELKAILIKQAVYQGETIDVLLPQNLAYGADGNSVLGVPRYAPVIYSITIHTVSNPI